MQVTQVVAKKQPLDQCKRRRKSRRELKGRSQGWLQDRQTKDCPEISSLASSVDSGSEVNPNLVWLWEALVSLLSLELVSMGTPAGRRPEVNGAGQGVLWLETFRAAGRRETSTTSVHMLGCIAF